MYDLIILGGGPAGYHAAKLAGTAGLNTILIEKSDLGGVCLNEGCIPSKTILNCAKLFSQAKSSKAFGITVEKASINLATIMERKQKIIETLRKGIEFSMKKSKVTVKNSPGTILSGDGGIFKIQTDDTVIEGVKLLICTGSEPIRPNIPGIEQDNVLYNREILTINSIPKKLAIIGGGAIGLELATFFAEVGSNVTVIEMLPSIGGPLDNDISNILKKELIKRGITFKLESTAMKISENSITVENKEHTETLETDTVLVSIGRRPITRNIGLENINLSCEKGAISTNERGRTSIAGVWAAGDVNGKSMLAHTAYREAEVCIADILGEKETINYSAIPAVIYTHPEVATVGLTKEEAENSGYETEMAKLPMTVNGRYLAETDGERGLCKVIVDKKTNTILGAHMIGSSCSEMIFGMANMIENKMKINDIRKTVFPHPTVSEIFKDCLPIFP